MVFLVENRLNLLTMPPLQRALAIRGEGRAVTRLGKLPWLVSSDIYYWGDIDVDGFLILSLLRNLFPQTESMLMDVDTLDAHKGFQVSGNDNPAAHAIQLDILGIAHIFSMLCGERSVGIGKDFAGLCERVY